MYEPLSEGVTHEDDMEQNHEGGGSLARIARGALYVFLALFPVLFVTSSIVSAEMTKFIGVSVVVLLALVASVGAGLQEGRLIVPRSAALYAFTAVWGALIIGALFAPDVMRGLVGGVGDVRTVLTFGIALLLFALIPSVYHRPEQVVRAVTIFTVGGLLALIFFTLRNILGVPLGVPRTFTVVGGWNAYGFFAGTMLLFALPFVTLERNSLFWKLGSAASLLAFLAVVAVNYALVWIGIGVISLVLLALYFSSGKRGSGVVTLTFFLIIAAVLFSLLQGPMGNISSKLGGTPEVAPSWQGMGTLTSQVIANDPVTGLGLNNFGLAWEKYRPASISETSFWRARFEGGVALLPTLVLEGGLIALIAILAFIVFVVGRAVRDVIRAVYYERGGWEESLTIGFFSASMFTLYQWIFYPGNLFLFFFGITILALATALSELHRPTEERTVELFGNAAKGFVASLALILLAVVAVAGLYFVGMRATSEFTFRSALANYNTTGELNASRDEIVRATTYYSNDATYFRAITDLERVRVGRIASGDDVRKETVQQSLNDAISRGIQAGQRAIELSRADAENWRSLGRLYATVIPLVDGASAKAIEQYEAARERSPRDPLILTELAQVHMATAELARRANDSGRMQAELARAITLLEEATEIKRDYAPAHFMLAQLYSANGKEKEAIARAVAAYQLAPNEVGPAFQLGVLAYRAKDYKTAKIALERALAINENYANARYFLGLTLADQGSVPEAIVEFERVLTLNAGNKELETILANLRSGKPALTGITPSPTERTEPPVAETTPPKQ